MNKGKLIILLRSFSKEELKKFKDFLLSPYFNKNKTLIKYFTELIKDHPQFEKADKEKIYTKLFKGKNYNEQVMKNLTSDLKKLCMDFLIIEIGKNDKYENKLNLLRQMILRKADPVFYSELKIFEAELKQVSELSEKNFYFLYQLEDAKISFHLERNEQPLVFDKFLKSGEYLILFFLLNLTKTISNLNVNRQSFNVKHNVNLVQEFFENTNVENIIEYMKSNAIEFSETAELYYYRIICNTPPYDEKNYFKFKDLVLRNINSLNRVEVYGLFNALETFCLIKINSGASDFNRELFEIFKLEIEKDFYKYSETSPLTFMKFRNTYLTAFTLNEYEWIENFIKDYGKEIIESDRENAIRIANAQLEFERGNYEKVLESVAGINADHAYSKIDIRNLTVMSYYELNHIESALSMIDSYRHFINNSSNLSEIFRESHLRFVNSLNSLIIFKGKGQSEKLLELKDKLLPFRNDRRVRWLMEKIDGVEK